MFCIKILYWSFKFNDICSINAEPKFRLEINQRKFGCYINTRKSQWNILLLTQSYKEWLRTEATEKIRQPNRGCHKLISFAKLANFLNFHIWSGFSLCKDTYIFERGAHRFIINVRSRALNELLKLASKMRVSLRGSEFSVRAVDLR